MIINYSSYHPSSCRYYLIIPNILLHRNIIIINNIITIHHFSPDPPQLIRLLEDHSTTSDGIAVYQVAYQVFLIRMVMMIFKKTMMMMISVYQVAYLSQRGSSGWSWWLFSRWWCDAFQNLKYITFSSWLNRTVTNFQQKGDLELSGGRQQLVPQILHGKAHQGQTGIVDHRDHRWIVHWF